MNKELHVPLKKESEETSLFLTKGRITFKTYFFRFTFCLILYAFVYFSCLYYEQENIDKVFGINLEPYSFFLRKTVLFLLIGFLWIQRIKRMHDLNQSGWYSLIPFLIFKSGTKGKNDYGADPKVEFPQYFDQRDDFEKQSMALWKKKKRRRIACFSVLAFYFLVFMISLIGHTAPIVENTVDSIVTDDDILGSYTVKQLHYDDTKTAPMYAYVQSAADNTFDICIKSDWGDRKITFLRDGDETLYSEQLGTGTIEHYDFSTKKRISLTFIDKNNVVWYFTK